MGLTINEKQTEFLSPKVREFFLCRPNNVGTFQFGVSQTAIVQCLLAKEEEKKGKGLSKEFLTFSIISDKT